jgi:hypothetical protein
MANNRPGTRHVFQTAWPAMQVMRLERHWLGLIANTHAGLADYLGYEPFRVVMLDSKLYVLQARDSWAYKSVSQLAFRFLDLMRKGHI